MSEQPYGEPEVVRGMEPSDLVLPAYDLVQRTSSQVVHGAKPGQFYHSLRNNTVDEVKAIVLDIRAVRTRWGRDEISSEPPLCSSDEAAAMKAVDGSDCSKCEWRCDAPWEKTPEERRGLCLKGYTLIGLDLENDLEPFLLRTSGLSALPIRELASGIMFRQRRQRTGIAKVLFKAISKESKYGPVFVIQPEVMEYMKPNEIQELIPMALEFKALPTARISGYIEAPAGEQPFPEAPEEVKEAEAPEKVKEEVEPPAKAPPPAAEAPPAGEGEKTAAELFDELFPPKKDPEGPPGEELPI